MAACGGLEHIFEKPLPDSPSSFLESLSPWKHIQSMKPIDDSSFTELFGELHFKENHHDIHNFPTESSSSSTPSLSPTVSSSFDTPKIENITRDSLNQTNPPTSSSYNYQERNKQYKHSDSFSSMNSESLSLCTEGLGFESFDDVVEDFPEFKNREAREARIGEEHEIHPIHECPKRSSSSTLRRRSTGTIFPPPISCIGRRSGKPWVCFKSYRHDGRFILKEVRIPTQEFLHACREDGRLRLRFVQSDDETIDEDDEEQDDDDDDDDDDENEVITIGNNEEVNGS